MRYAEVIGDPIAQSRSPAIHRHWLDGLGSEGDYRATQVRPHELVSYLEGRRRDPDWLGCNVTIPHKENIAAHIDEVAPDALAVGAVNCVVRSGERLVGHNTDVEGVAASVGHVPVEGRPVTMIGAGGAARAMLAYLQRRSVAEVTIIARDEVKVASLQMLWPDLRLTFQPISGARITRDAALIVNASPLGMTGRAPMPQQLLQAVEASEASLFDMVYQPLETDFLRVGKAAGVERIDGLTMLIGQARRAFSLFFGAQAPAGADAVRAVLTNDNLPSLRTA